MNLNSIDSPSSHNSDWMLLWFLLFILHLFFVADFIDSAFLATQKTKADADFYTAQRAAEANKVNN